MSKEYDVEVRWHIGAAPETTTVHVEATTTAQALKLARRGIYLDHPGAAIDKTEIVYLEKPQEPDMRAELMAQGSSAADDIAAKLEADRIALLTDPKVKVGAAVVADFVAERPERAVVVAAPEPVETGDCPTDRASALVTEIAKRYGATAVGAFLDAMDEFMGSRRADGWNGSRLFIKIAKVSELKRKAA